MCVAPPALFLITYLIISFSTISSYIESLFTGHPHDSPPIQSCIQTQTIDHALYTLPAPGPSTS